MRIKITCLSLPLQKTSERPPFQEYKIPISHAMNTESHTNRCHWNWNISTFQSQSDSQECKPSLLSQCCTTYTKKLFSWTTWVYLTFWLHKFLLFLLVLIISPLNISYCSIFKPSVGLLLWMQKMYKCKFLTKYGVKKYVTNLHLKATSCKQELGILIENIKTDPWKHKLKFDIPNMKMYNWK